MGEEDMMSFIHTQIKNILKPYAENVYELHQTVVDLSTHVSELQEQSDAGVREQHAATARMDGMQKFAESTRQFLDSAIDEAGKLEQQRAKAMQNVNQTLTLIKCDIEKLRQDDADMRKQLTACQDAEKVNRSDCVQLRSKYHQLGANLTKTDQAAADLSNKVDSLARDIAQNKAQISLNKEIREKYIALDEQSLKFKQRLDLMTAENESHLKQYRNFVQEVEEARDSTTNSLSGMKDELGKEHTETQAKFDSMSTDFMSQFHASDTKHKNLELTVTESINKQDQLWSEILGPALDKLEDLDSLTGKHEEKVDALVTATKLLEKKNRLDMLQEDAEFAGKRHLRVEKVLGLEPLTKDNEPGKRKVKKRASTMMLGDDQLLRKAWAAWMEAMYDAKEKQITDAIPKMQDMLKVHFNLIESEKSRLNSTKDQVQTLEMSHTKSLEELQTLRKNLDLERSHWQGLTSGLQAAKKTMYTEGDGEMLPSATRLRQALSPLRDAASRPATRDATSRPVLSSLVSPLPRSS